MACPAPGCPYERDSSECVLHQRTTGCHACDRMGCWRTNTACPFFRYASREDHADASFGDNVPHLRQTDMVCVAAGAVKSGLQQTPNWWEQCRPVFFVTDGSAFALGMASGEGCNCLIDTLRQALGIICNVEYVRAELHKIFPQLRLGEYLELQLHWKTVITLLGQADLVTGGVPLNPADFRIVCFDMTDIGHGDVEGDGCRVLHIARQNRNHFVPLIRCRGDMQHVLAVAQTATAVSSAASTRLSQVSCSFAGNRQGPCQEIANIASVIVSVLIELGVSLRMFQVSCQHASQRYLGAVAVRACTIRGTCSHRWV